MIRGRTGAGGSVEFYDQTTGDVEFTVDDTTDGGAVTATEVTATAISPGSATTVQGILAELAARITALETP